MYIFFRVLIINLLHLHISHIFLRIIYSSTVLFINLIFNRKNKKSNDK